MNALRKLAEIIHDVCTSTLCAADFHGWRYQPGIQVRGETYGPYRACRHCGTNIVLAVEPPAGHPDSMTRELSRQDEEWLAALDHELFPEETR